MISDLTTALTAFLVSRPTQYDRARLMTFTLKSGQVIRVCDKQNSQTIPSGAGPLSGLTFIGGNPSFTPGKVTCAIGGSAQEHDVTIIAGASDLISGIPAIAFIAGGGFNLADYSLDYAFSAGPGQPWLGTLNRFSGIVAEVTDCGSVSAKLNVKDYTYLLDTDWPKNTVQPDCLNTLYDAGCTLSKASFAVSGVVQAGSTVNAIQTALSNPDDYFDLGTVTFTSGVLDGLTGWIRLYASGVIHLATPLLVAPSAGDTFLAYPGCDLTASTCASKFSNLPNFAGFPFVPEPEVSY